MPEPDFHRRRLTVTDFRALCAELIAGIDEFTTVCDTGEPFYQLVDRARKELKAAEDGERLSSGKLVSERIDELLAEVQQRDLESVEIILGSRAFQLYCKERHVYAPGGRLHGGYHGLPVTKSDSEAAEYVAIEYQQ